ncbi:hypothetical protein ES707_13411 [subsurface metagenome]
MGDLYLPWPYAAKAVIQHEFDTDHLNIWVTFRFAMDIETIPPGETEPVPVKPPNELWLVKADDALKPVSASAWQDAWTLLLTVPDIGANPDRVLVEYDGPNENLRISWHKQWEPWGPILSLDISS